MAIGQAQAAEATNRIWTEDISPVMLQDRYQSTVDYGPELGELAPDAAATATEILRRAESCGAILDEADADIVLMLRMIARRNAPIRGVWSRMQGLRNHLFNNIAASGNPVGQWIGSHQAQIEQGTERLASNVVVSGALWTAKALIGSAINIGNPLAAAAFGGTAGAIRGYQRAKDQTESVSTWMSELGILKSNKADLDDETFIAQKTDGELLFALGVMDNAIRENRVRGSDAQLIEMAVKYHQIKNLLTDRRNERTNSGEVFNPALKVVDDALSTSESEQGWIGRKAAKEYKESYEKIRNLKINRVAMSTLRAGAIGATVGGALGWFMAETPLGHRVAQWLGDRIPGGQHEDSLVTLKHQIEGRPDFIASDKDYHRILTEFNGLQDGTVNYDSLTPADQAVMQQYGKLLEVGPPASPYGLDHDSFTDLNNAVANSTIDTSQVHDMVGMHNIDLNYRLPGGQTLAQGLLEHKDIYTAWPYDIQHFVISHPAYAEEFFNLGNGDPGAVSALFEKYGSLLALGGISAVAVPAGVYAHNRERALNTEIRSTVQGKREELRDAEKLVDQPIINTRKETLKSEVLFPGQQIRLIFNQLPLRCHRPPHPPHVVDRPNDIYVIDEVKSDGRIRFKDSDWDRQIRSQYGTRFDPTPVVNIDDITLNYSTELDTRRAQVVFGGPDAVGEMNKQLQPDKKVIDSLETMRRWPINQQLVGNIVFLDRGVTQFVPDGSNISIPIEMKYKPVPLPEYGRYRLKNDGLRTEPIPGSEGMQPTAVEASIVGLDVVDAGVPLTYLIDQSYQNKPFSSLTSTQRGAYLDEIRRAYNSPPDQRRWTVLTIADQLYRIEEFTPPATTPGSPTVLLRGLTRDGNAGTNRMTIEMSRLVTRNFTAFNSVNI
ncbi:MAG: hypothetical protein WCG48_00825 [Candidatus Berkelbacteria bacterium]